MIDPPDRSSGLAGDLLDLDDDELGRLERREADQDVDDAEVDVVLRGRLPVALARSRPPAGVLPWNAPCRNRSCMNAPTFSRICAHSGSSLGSNTTHCVPRYRLSSMNSASRRTGHVLVLVGQLVGAAQRPRAPDDAADDRETCAGS